MKALKVSLVVLAGAAIAGVIVFGWVGDDLVERRLRPATVRLLEERFNSHVELGRLTVQVFPTLAVRGEGLVLRHRERLDLPPLISIRAFNIEGGLRELWNRRIDRVRLEGLHIIIPPRRRADMPTMKSSSKPDASATSETGAARERDVLIREVITENSQLTITAKTAGKSPREFQLRNLRFENLQFDKPMAFAAELSNPVPTGTIHTIGSFGPWNKDEPSLTVINGSYRFAADLGSIKGISGDLQAEGSYNGPLEEIHTEGRTKTTNFRLSTGAAEFPLNVHYKATVDGTSGDTILDSVEADLGQSHISAAGAIVKVEGAKGRRITLDTNTTGGRIEDFIRLTTRVATSPLTGNVDVKAKLDIPPGERDVIERMDLDGTFHLSSARFTGESVQSKIDVLSRAGRGRPGDEAVDDVASEMRGAFKLSNGTMTLRSLSFKVEGAEVRLAGTYGVESGRLNFAGQLRLSARVSQTQTGWRSVLLKAFDPVFNRDGAGTLLPITITGTKDAPKFGVEMKRALLRQ